MFGMGSGGTIAILAAQADPRINTLDVLDPWGDWPDWFRNTAALSPEDREKFSTPEFLGPIATLDPVAYLPDLQTRNIRIQQMISDPVTPSVAKVKISSAAPFRTILVKYQSPEDLFKTWQVSGLTGWIKQQLHSTPQKGTPDEHNVAKN
jgi:hypothetical protein